MSGGCVVGGGRNCDNDLTHFEGEGMSAKMHHKECAFYYDLFCSFYYDLCAKMRLAVEKPA